MEGMREVRLVDDQHLHWRAGPAEQKLEWSSVITEREHEKALAWHDSDDPQCRGIFAFTSLDQGSRESRW